MITKKNLKYVCKRTNYGRLNGEKQLNVLLYPAKMAELKELTYHFHFPSIAVSLQEVHLAVGYVYGERVQ